MNRALCGLVFFLSTFPLLAPRAFALPPDAIGHIQTLRGQASLLRGEVAVPAAIGLPVFGGDRVRTSRDGAVGVVLADDTTFTLGPGSDFAIREFAFDPEAGKFSLILKMLKGTCVYLSGLIGKLSPEDVRLEIPDATITVRGTRLLLDVRR